MVELDEETKLYLGFALLALVLGIAVDVYAGQADWVAFAVILIVGMVAPRVAMKLLDVDSALEQD
ncbi:MAG: hypothetical protein V5A38_01440 [Halolamina sp.]|jgi:hypothetical protein|uniref:hypothetical protein n=1 Tax=Halolamina sp. TaxID=1940283 RepID=UPI002FC352F6